MHVFPSHGAPFVCVELVQRMLHAMMMMVMMKMVMMMMMMMMVR